MSHQGFISKPPPHRADEAFTGLDLAAGRVPGKSSFALFGRSDVVTTTLQPLSIGNQYNMPQVGGVVNLRIKAGGNAADTAAGAGARQVLFTGLDVTGAVITEAVATAGAAASAATSALFLRLLFALVTESGTYANDTTASHFGSIVIEDSGGVEDWATIDATGFGRARTEIGFTTVPFGKQHFISGASAQVDSNKPANLVILRRSNILETVAPFTPLFATFELIGLASPVTSQLIIPSGPLPELTDYGWFAAMQTGTGSVIASFSVIEEDL